MQGDFRVSEYWQKVLTNVSHGIFTLAPVSKEQNTTKGWRKFPVPCPRSKLQVYRAIFLFFQILSVCAAAATSVFMFNNLPNVLNPADFAETHTLSLTHTYTSAAISTKISTHIADILI